MSAARLRGWLFRLESVLVKVGMSENQRSRRKQIVPSSTAVCPHPQWMLVARMSFKSSTFFGTYWIPTIELNPSCKPFSLRMFLSCRDFGPGLTSRKFVRTAFDSARCWIILAGSLLIICFFSRVPWSGRHTRKADSNFLASSSCLWASFSCSTDGRQDIIF